MYDMECSYPNMYSNYSANTLESGQDIINHKTKMSDGKVKCDNKSGANQIGCLSSDWCNSYQKSKFRRKKRRSTLVGAQARNRYNDPANFGIQNYPLSKENCYHQTRCSYQENAPVLIGTRTRPVCVFDCNHVDQSHSSGNTHNNTNTKRKCLFQRTHFEKNKSFPKTKLRYSKSNIRNYLSVSNRHRILFFFIQFLILHHLIELTQVESFGHHNRFPSAPRLVLKNSVFASSQSSRISRISERTVKSQGVLQPKDNHNDQRSKSITAENNRMQSDSPFSVENDQEIWKNLR